MSFVFLAAKSKILKNLFVNYRNVKFNNLVNMKVYYLLLMKVFINAIILKTFTVIKFFMKEKVAIFHVKCFLSKSPYCMLVVKIF